jgi:uncharacterized protein YlzI (FlbEa/FlbD family)
MYSAMRVGKMARFIQLLDVQNKTIDVDPDHIEMLKSSADTDPNNPGTIQLTSGRAMKVKQTVEEIKELIRQSRQRQVL